MRIVKIINNAIAKDASLPAEHEEYSCQASPVGLALYRQATGEDWREYLAPEYDAATQMLGAAVIGATVTHAVVARSIEDLTTMAQEAFKAARQLQVDAIKVTTAAGHTFDGDEISQTRIARAIAGLDPLETIIWVLADNTVIQASREELREALRLAGREQEAIWVA